MIALRSLASVIFYAGLAGGPAQALNWEGHDDWFLNPALIEAFTRSLPPPLAAPMPTCAEREAAARANAYEQIPIAGLNCRKGPRVPRKSGAGY